QEEFPDIENNDRVIGMVANFNREVKRADLFIKTAAEVLKQHDDVKFLLIGGGELEHQLKNQISCLGLQGKVLLGGKKEPSAPYIKSFDIGVLTSDSEGFSNVLLEYMAAGIPVVATDVGGNTEIIRNQGLGQLVPKGDWADLAQSICMLLDDNAHCRELGENARGNVVEHYSWDKRIRDVESYYEELLEL
ncbi:MAG TPA: glycosyltransferase, partial [Syntrophobacteraceae bacterium]|nr:glycosyltransferase [Syntrophobacteraceae bacterium]